MAQKLPDYPDAGGLAPADAQTHLSNVNGSQGWGTNVSQYTRKAAASLPLDDAVRQRFAAQANRRVAAAISRSERLEGIANDIMPELDTSKSAMSQTTAERELQRVMHRSVAGQLGVQAMQAVQVLPENNPIRQQFLEILRARSVAERDIAQNGASTISDLQAGAS